MPRTPEVCPALFCPLSHFSNIASRVLRVRPLALRYLQSAFGRLPSESCRLPTAVRRPRYTFCLLLLVITCHSSLVAALAQGTTATLSGNVTDQNDAVIPDVSIAVINIAQGFQRSAKTNGEGTFVVPLLPPGNYTVKAEHEGFTPTEVRDVVLNVNDKVAMRIHMNVGTLSQTVQIVEGSSLINESPTVATVVDRQFVANLPLNGRSFQSLITLSPGVVITKSSNPEQGQFSVNGQRANANYFTVDGVSANIGVSIGADPYQAATGALPGLAASGGTNNLVSVDALQEFKIQTSTYAAEFGRTPGAQVQIITRSGTNQFHGSAFDYFRNEALDANDWFNNARRLAKPATRQSDFGFVFGGPALLPRFGEGGRQPGYNGRNRTFFFFSYEGLRLRLPQSRSVDVPSLAARQVAPDAVKSILNTYPLPNGPDRIGTNGLPNGFAAFNASFSNPSNLDATSVRIDHTVSNKLTLFGRYNFAPSQIVERGQGSALTINTLAHFALTTETLTGGATLSIAPNISNELRANYSRNEGKSFYEIDSFAGAVVPSDSLLFPQGTSRKSALVSFSLVTVNTSLQAGTAADNLQRQFNVVDNVSVISGAHQAKFGVDYRRLSPVIRPQDYNLTVQFNGVGTPGATTQPSGTALSSIAGFARARSSTGARFPLFTNLSLYGQDNWKLGRRLTLTYGLRWELNTPPTERNGNDPFTVAGLDNPATATLAPRGTPLWNTTYNNFAPRVGVAYQLFQKPGRETVLRGGFGIFYDLGYGSIVNAFGNAYPFAASRQTAPAPFPLSTSTTAAPTVPTLDFFYVFEPNVKLPRTYQWNVSFEQAVGVNQSLSVSYVAAVGRKLLREDTLWGPPLGGTLNPAVFPSNAQVIVTRNSATSDYHAMQLQFQRRLSRGLQALASYTWAHSIDIASNDSFNVNTPADRVDPRSDRGPSNFDVRHAFNGAITYNIPVPDAGTVGNAILRNWSVDALFTARSATPVNVTYTTFGIPGIGVASVRPDLVPGIPLYLNDPTAPGGRRFNNTRVTVPGNPNPQIGPFLRPVAARQGSLGRNALRGFSVYQLDVALRRQFNLGERANLQLRGEFFNILNHPNFGDPDPSLTSSTFGFSTSMLGRSLGSGGSLGGFNPLYQIGGPRSIQLSLKLGF